MRWVFRPAREHFSEYRRVWDEVNRAWGNHVLLDSAFVEPLVRHFASSDTLIGITKGSSPALALVSHGQMGLWHTFQPAQGPLGLILLNPANGAIEQIYSLMRSLPGYALGLGVQQQDSEYTAFRGLGSSPRIEILEYIKTARVSVVGSFDEYWQKRERDLIENIARRRRRLAQQGIEVCMDVNRSPCKVAECIGDYGRMETAGWKGQRGTAVTLDNTQGMFYREILERFCEAGEGVIFSLRFNEATVASQLCLERGGMLVSLKIAYDEAYRNHSPGFLLQEEIIRHLYSEGKVRAFEFYGRVREGWTTKWTREIRPMYHVNFHRHRWVASARRLVKQSWETLQRLRSGKLA